MKNSFLLLVLILIFSCDTSNDDNQSLKQNAIEGYFELTTQQEVNDFGELGYTSIDGSLVIRNSSDITSLKALRNIKGIYGFLLIQNNEQLVSLSGLDNLQYMCDEEPTSISILDNNSLTDISALGNINYCETVSLSLERNNVLSNIDAFSNITKISKIILEHNELLTDISAFDNLEYTSYIRLNGGNFSNIGFSNLKSCDKLSITSCNNLTHVNSLSKLTSLRVLAVGFEDAFLQYTYSPNLSNQSLTSLEGLKNVTNLEGIAIGGGSKNLTSLPVFKGNIRSIAIHATALENLDGFSEGIQEYKTDLYIYNNYNLKNVDGLLNYPVLGEVYLVNNSSLNNIDGFDNVTKIENGYILIDGNTILQADSVFENLKSIDFYDLHISNNNGFANFSGFNLLDTQDLGVYFDNNTDLISINGFNAMKQIGLNITNNNKLVSVNGFDSVTQGGLNIGQSSSPQPIEIIDVFRSNANLNGLLIYKTNISNLDRFKNYTFTDYIMINDNILLVDFCGIRNQVAARSPMFYIARNNGYNPTWNDLLDGNCN